MINTNADRSGAALKLGAIKVARKAMGDGGVRISGDYLYKVLQHY